MGIENDGQERQVDMLQELSEARIAVKRLEAEVKQLREKQSNWQDACQSALEIIRYDETLACQSPYWRSMLLSLVEGLSIEAKIIEQHIEFEVNTVAGEPTDICMTPKTSEGMKLIQIWGVMDMLKELVEGLKCKSVAAPQEG
jgi:FtsZ-binding cell division protein ZapB